MVLAGFPLSECARSPNDTNRPFLASGICSVRAQIDSSTSRVALETLKSRSPVSFLNASAPMCASPIIRVGIRSSFLTFLPLALRFTGITPLQSCSTKALKASAFSASAAVLFVFSQVLFPSGSAEYTERPITVSPGPTRWVLSQCSV